MAFQGSHYLTDEKLSIARGIVRGVESVHKFGAVPSMSNTTSGTVWDVDDTLYPWSTFDTPSLVTVDSSSASDVGLVVVVQGLDADYNRATDVITMSSQTGNSSTVVFSRVFRAFVQDASTNVGNVDIKIGATTVARITASFGQTLMAIYTIPVGYTGYLSQGTSSCGPNDHATGDMFVRYGGQTTFRVGHAFEVSGGYQYTYQFSVPVEIPEKSDIDVRMTMVSGNNSRITSAFDLILVKN